LTKLGLLGRKLPNFSPSILPFTVRSLEAWKENLLKSYFDEISRIPLLTPDEEILLARQARQGQEAAVQRLVEANLRFVVMVAKEYQDRGLPLVDLINEGNLGLIEAAKRYDASRGTKFISYAVWWIRQAILQALSNYVRMVRLPINQVWALNKVVKASETLVQTLGRDPSIDEIAEKLNTSSLDLLKNMRYWGKDVSLEDSLGQEDSELRVIDRISDTELPTPDSPLLQEAMKDEIADVLSSLEKREKEVLRLIFGIDGERPLTLGEIGVRMNISRERVRQIKNKALRKLRHTSRRERLRPFLG